MHITNVPALIRDSGANEVMLEAYEAVPTTYDSLVEVRPIEETNLYGIKGTEIQGVGRFKIREDKQEVEADEPGQGPTWQGKVRQFSRRIDIPKRMVDAANAANRITSMVQEFAQDFGRTAALDKDEFWADMYQKGTLTAGSRRLFDGSFPENTDPNPEFIYTGQPWFDTAHSVAGTNYANHVATRALSTANLQSSLITMRSTNNVNDRGDRIRVRPDTLIVPAALEYTARTILESSQLPGSANNDINAVRGALDLVVWDALADSASSAAWWLSQRGQGKRSYESGAPTFRLAFDEKTQTWMLIAEFLFCPVVTNWRFDFANNTAAA